MLISIIKKVVKLREFIERGIVMAKNMTEGNVPKLLLGFTIPTILGNVFQLTYNTADSIIVGRFSGEKGLAAIGCAGPIMNIVTFLIVGLCLGASVLMSEYYGAGKKETLQREFSTALLTGLIFTVILSSLLAIFAKPILLLIRTPNDILKETTTYLHIICVGFIATFLYNVYASSLRSIGDSKTPILFLALSAILNVALDLLFVAGLGMGVIGAAWATVISQMVSVSCCIIYVYKKIPTLQLKLHQYVIDMPLFKITVGYSWASAMQQTCLYIGKVFIQAAVNPLGVDSIATFNAVNRVDDFALTPEQSIAHSMTVFLAQNRGAEKKKRVRQGFFWGILIEILYGIFICCVVFGFSSNIMGIFMDGNSKVRELGVLYLTPMAFFYILPAITNGIQGYFRGMGKMKITLVATFVQIVVRVICSYLFAPIYGLQGIAFSCFFGWIGMLLYELPVLFKHWKKY